MSPSLNKVIQEKNTLNHEISLQEFEVWGFPELLSKKGFDWRLVYRTPLNNNKHSVGIKETYLDYIINTKKLLIISIKNPKKCDKHLFYVYNPEVDSTYLNGRYNGFQYITFDKLRIIEEFLGCLK